MSLTVDAWVQAVKASIKDWTDESLLPVAPSCVHPNDAKILFIQNDKRRNYFVYPYLPEDKESKKLKSVTTLIHRWFEEHDELYYARATVCGSKFQTNKSPWNPYLTLQGVAAAQLLVKLEASTLGTLMHRSFELWLSSKVGELTKEQQEELKQCRSSAKQKSVQNLFKLRKNLVVQAVTEKSDLKVHPITGRVSVGDVDEEVLFAKMASESGEKKRKRSRSRSPPRDQDGDIVEFQYFHDFWHSSIVNANKVTDLQRALVRALSTTDDDFEVNLLLWQEECELEIHRLEWRIFDPKTFTTGTIDCVMRVRLGEQWLKKHKLPLHLVGKFLIVLLDWKRTRELKYKSFTGRDRGKGAFAHLQDCNFVHYSIQLNLYKYMLEKNYKIQDMDIAVVAMCLCIFHPIHGKFRVEEVQSEGVWTPLVQEMQLLQKEHE